MTTPAQHHDQHDPSPRIAGLAPRWALLCLLADVICVLLFALGGHQSHEAASSQVVTMRIAWPFLVGALVGWAVLVRQGWPARAIWPAGAAVLAATYLLGLVLRLISGRGVSGGFPLVTIIFLAITMLGWRAFVTAKLRYRR